MVYTDFLTMMKDNTGNNLADYKRLCRFCLQNQPNGFDMGEDSYNTKSQRDAILNNYTIITKRYLPISGDYPNFVCSSCVSNVSLSANFVQQIEQTAEYWETFLKAINDLKYHEEREEHKVEVNVLHDCDELNSTGDVEIKIECNDMCGEDILNTDTVVCDALELPTLKTEVKSGISKEFTAAAAIKRKRRRTAEKTFMNTSTEFERTCKLCDHPTFSTLQRMFSHHRLNHPGDKIFSCDICGTEFISKNPLYTHMKDRHSNCGKKHQCQFCAKLFYSDRELKEHEKYHLNIRSYICNLCGKSFNKKTALNSHLKTKVHNANYKPPKWSTKEYRNDNKIQKVYRCDQCTPQTIFSSLEERTNHRNAVHKIYECEICKNSFMTMESLSSHKLLHSNKPRPYVCSICGATFNQSSHLTTHFRCKHTDEKSFQCPLCDKAFYEKGSLNAHTNLVHKKQDRVKCDKCDSDFASIRYLQMHTMVKHAPERPYDCKICGEKNGTSSKLKQHRRKHHQIFS